MAKFIVALLALFVSTAQAAEWTQEQKTLAGIGLAALVIDYGQTRSIMAHPERWAEANPMLGEHPSTARLNTYFTLVPLVSYFALDAIPSRHRTTALKVMTSLQLACVGRNAYLGIHVKF
jgi:hypothetical protein